MGTHCSARKRLFVGRLDSWSFVGNWKKKLTDIGFGFLGYRTFYKKLTETVFKDNVLVFSFGIG